MQKILEDQTNESFLLKTENIKGREKKSVTLVFLGLYQVRNV